MTHSDWEPKTKSCPACGSSELVFCLTTRYWRDYPLTFDECKSCGCTFANPMPSESLIARGNDALVRLYQKGRTFDHEFRDARQAYLRGRVFAKKLGRVKKRGRLLEIGCYDGFFLAGVRDHSDWTIEGIEIAKAPAEFAKNFLKLCVHHGTLETLIEQDAALGREGYDFVLASDLIEHINRPEAFLSAISRLAKPGARFELITPNAKQDLAFAKRAHASGQPLPQVLNHVIYYTPRSLTQALKRAGFQVEELYCYDVRHALKDFGLFGLGNPRPSDPGPSISEIQNQPIQDLRSQWNESRLEELRKHPKTGALYGWYRERLPRILRIKVPPGIEVGHEIFCQAVRR